MKKLWRSRTVRIPLIYCIFSVIWIFSTDRLNYLITPNPEMATTVAMIKGTAFVLASTALIYLLLRFDDKQKTSLNTELKVVQDSFTYLFARNPLPMWMYDPENKHFLAVNEAACELYGYKADEFLSKRLEDISPAAEFTHLLAELRSGQPSLQRSGPWQQVKRDGATLYAYIFGVPIQYAGRSVILATVFDISQQREVEKALRTTETQRDDYEAFSYSIAHDLRTPLRAVRGYGEVLLSGHASHLNQEAQGYISAMVQAGEEMEQMIDNLLILTRLKRTSLNPSSVDLAQIANEVMAQFARLEPERKVEFTCIEHALVKADAALMKNLFNNLLENSWKFTSTREITQIEFGSLVDPKKGRVYFVRDNGLGFSSQEADLIFKPFHRLTGADNVSGTGIGLSIVARIVERHNGQVWAEGEPGKGATIYFTLGLE
jgi:PAS domain S-box-containing protein